MNQITKDPLKVSIKNRRENFYSKYLEKSDVIEISIDLLEPNEVFDLIGILYDDLTEPTPSNYKLFKLLVKMEHMILFDMCIKRSMNPNKYKTDIFDEIKADVRRSRSTINERCQKEELSEESEHMMENKGNRYDVNEIVSDSFSNAIIMNKMHIAFYLYREYKQAVLGNIQVSIEAIIYAFQVDYLNYTKILNCEEKLFILEKFLPFIDYKKSFELLETFKNLLFEEPDHNFLTYSLNPLKIIVVMMTIINQLQETYPLLKFQIDILQEGLQNVGSHIIKNSKSVEDVEDLLLDKLYNGIEIIDMVAYLNIIPILQNPVVDVIISNMYYGPYQRDSFLKNSMSFQVIYNEVSFFPGKEVTASSKMSVFKFKQGKRIKKKNKRNIYEIDEGDSDDSSKLLEVKANQENNVKKKIIIGHMFQFVVWRKALDVRYLFNALIAFVLAVTMQVFSVLLITQ